MGVTYIGGCDCCPDVNCSAFCNATSFDVEVTMSVSNSVDSFRPCSVPCAGTWNIVQPLIISSGSFESGAYDGVEGMDFYKDRWKPWNTLEPALPGFELSGSSVCQAANDYFGGMYYFYGHCAARSSFQFGYSVVSPWPASHSGYWSNNVWYPVSTQSHPGFVGPNCSAVTPSLQNGLCNRFRGVTTCQSAVKYPEGFHGIDSTGDLEIPDTDPPEYYADEPMEDAFYDDDCEDFCGSTYDGNAVGSMRVYSSTFKVTVNCLP